MCGKWVRYAGKGGLSCENIMCAPSFHIPMIEAELDPCTCGEGEALTIGYWSGENGGMERAESLGIKPHTQEYMDYLIGGAVYYVRCVRCGRTIEGKNQTEAIEKWNRGEC